jgi:hypothetical protein
MKEMKIKEDVYFDKTLRFQGFFFYCTIGYSILANTGFLNILGAQYRQLSLKNYPFTQRREHKYKTSNCVHKIKTQTYFLRVPSFSSQLS